MQTEFEVKILDIDVEKIIERLEHIRATYIAEKIQRRYVYDLIPPQENAWIRLRTDGTVTTLTIKKIEDDSLEGTKETEITVHNFEKTNTFLSELGYSYRSYQENKRISYELDGVQIEIDFWPQIPPYLEIEGKSRADVEKVVSILGFHLDDTTSINTTKVYEKYGIDLESIKDLRLE